MNENENNREWWRADELAVRWGVDPSTVYRWRRDGEIPTMRVGGIVRIHRSVVEHAENKAKHQASVAAVRRLRKRFKGVPDRIGSLD